ncbi:hypothetical protein ACHHRT_02845 [Desulfurivibrio sp. D14AmB]|uniref:hypothetical protein n=1 Tax=Desulfurivibrio sp. D14AmB TaxID=3374370 RepID=UPI00376ECB9A
MTGDAGTDSREGFLSRVGREAELWALRALPLPGGLVLLEKELSSRERQRFLLLLGGRIGPPGLAPLLGEPTPLPRPEATDRPEEPAPASIEPCQVTLEERQHLFNCFQMES